MKPRDATAALVVLVALALAVQGCGDAAPARHFNVLVITLDTTRADRFAAYGQHDRVITPRLDAFAQQGVTFERAFSNSSFTPPSHASIFTGRYPSEHGLMHWSDTLGPVATAAELFAAAGYRTLAISPLKTLFRLGLDRGFAATFEPPHTEGEGLLYLADATAINATVLPELLADDARPFFAWLHYYDAHRVYGRQGRQWAERFASYPDPTIGATERFYQLSPADRDELGLSPAETRFIIDRYDGGLAWLDQQVGALLADLEAAGVLDDTIVVITADHGEVLDEHDEEWFSHDPYLVEENIRVPLFVRLPDGAHAGLRVPDLVQGVDILPTLLALAGVEPGDASFAGLDLSPTLDGRALRRDFVYAERRGRDNDPAERDRRRMLRTPTHKLIQASDHGTTEVFAVDDEHHDLAATDSELFHRLMGAYEQQLRTLQAPGARGGGAGLDPETLRLLIELGYAVDADSAPPTGDAPR